MFPSSGVHLIYAAVRNVPVTLVRWVGTSITTVLRRRTAIVVEIKLEKSEASSNTGLS